MRRTQASDPSRRCVAASARMTFSRPLKRLTAFTACACAVIGAAQIGTSSADLSNQINANKSAAQSLQSEINAETEREAAAQAGHPGAQQSAAEVAQGPASPSANRSSS